MSETIDPRVQRAADAFRQKFQALREEIGKVIVGHEAIVDGVLTCLFVGGHVLLEGVPGLGKTFLIRTLSQALSLNFNRIQFTPDLMPADIIGTNIVVENPATGGREFRFQPGPDLRPHRAGRRNQPRHAQDPVGPAGGHAGARRSPSAAPVTR